MKSTLPTIPLSDMPGFRKVIPKEVFLGKLDQQRQEMRMMKMMDERSAHFQTFASFSGSLFEFNRDILNAHQKMLIATYVFSFWFFESFVLLFPFPPISKKHDPPRLRIVRSP